MTDEKPDEKYVWHQVDRENPNDGWIWVRNKELERRLKTADPWFS